MLFRWCCESSTRKWVGGAVYGGGMGEMVEQVDGRRARRERGRRAVVEAAFELVLAGKVPPTAEDVAGRAGVSVSSVFRYFDGLDDLQRAAFQLFRQRYAHLLEPGDPAGPDRSDRVAAFVKTRVELFDAAGPMLQFARQRALDHEPLVEAVARNREELARQTRRAFAAEIDRLTPAEAADLCAVVDSATSPEAHHVMRAAHGRSSRQIARAWTSALVALFDGWPASGSGTTRTRTETDA